MLLSHDLVMRVINSTNIPKALVYSIYTYICILRLVGHCLIFHGSEVSIPS